MITENDVIISPHTEIVQQKDMVTIGNHVAIDFGFYCTTALTIGDYVHISPHVTVIGGKKTHLVVNDFCFISAGARLVCGSELFKGDGLVGPLIPYHLLDKQNLEPIVMERFSGVCTNSVIFPGVTLGEGSVVGACSLVKENTLPWTIYAGVPAKIIGYRFHEIMYENAKKLGYNYDSEL